METALDRTARRLRPLFFAAGVVALPVFFVSYFYMMKLLFAAVGPLAFAAVGVSHIIVWLAATMLHDYQKEKR